MNQWFANGYFSADLPVKRVEDLEYIPLQKLALRSPGQPFDISSSEGFTSPKFLLLSMIQQHQQQQQQNILEHQQSRLAGISLSGSPSPSNNNSFLGGGVGVGGPTEPDFNGLGGFNKSARMPSNPMFGQQQQQQLPINQGPSAAHRMIDPRLPREFMDHDPLLQNPVIGGGAWNENRQPIPWGGADNILIDQQRRMMALQQQQQQMNQNAYPSQFMGPGVNIPPNSFNPHLVDSFNADRRLQQQQQPLLAQNFPGGQPFGPNMGIQMPMQNEQFSHQQQSFMQMQQLQMIMQQQQQLQQQQQQNAFLKQQQEQELLLQQQQQPQQQQEDSKKGPVSPIRTQVQKGPSSLTTPTDMKSSPTSQVSLKHKKEENVTTTSPEKVKSPVSSAPSKIVPEEQQPVVTAATKATKKKKNKENAPESRHEKASSDNNYTEMNESSKPPAAVSSVWSSSSEKPALSLREIQEIEAKKKEERDRERARAAQQALLLEAQQLQEANASIVDSGSVWGAGATAAKAPASSKGKTLAEIMEEEERIKRSKEARISSVSSGAGGIESGGVKRYADSITGPVASFSSAASIVSSVPVASVVAPSSSVAAKIKPANAPPASVAAVVSAAPKAGTGWNTVGKPAK